MNNLRSDFVLEITMVIYELRREVISLRYVPDELLANLVYLLCQVLHDRAINFHKFLDHLCVLLINKGESVLYHRDNLVMRPIQEVCCKIRKRKIFKCF